MARGGKGDAGCFFAILAVVCAFVLAGAASWCPAQSCADPSGHFAARLDGVTAGASADAGSCGGSDAPETTVTFTAPRAGTYTFDTLGSSFDTVLYVRGGSNSELACNDDVELGVNAWSRVAVTLAAGQTVQVTVDGYASQAGDFVLRVNADCPLPFRADARDLGSAATWVVSGRSDCAPAVEPATGCGIVPWGRGVSFVYTAGFSGTFEFSTEGSEFDTLLAVRLGTCAGPELACNDDAAEANSGASRVHVDLSIGQTVVLVVAGKGSAAGDFVLSGTGVPFTPTVTATRTRTRTPTATRTFTVRPTATHSRTASFTRTFTPTPSATATRAPSRTPTPTRSRTATATLRATPTPTPTRPATATATVSASTSATASVGATATPSVTPSATGGLPSGVCCQFPSGTIPRCEVLAVAACSERGGIPVLSGTCTPDGCAGGVTPTASPTARPTNTPTARATLTLVPSATPTATAGGSLWVTPTRVQAGARVSVSGRVESGNAGVRLWFDTAGEWLRLADWTVEPDGRFALTLRVPDDAEAGEHRLCAASIRPGVAGRDLVCSGLTVEVAPSASLAVLALEGGDPASGVRVYLHDVSGAVVAAADSDEAGRAQFATLPAGVYDVRAVCAGGGSCSPALYFPLAKVVLAPGAQRSLALHAVVPAPTGAIDLAGAVVLPGGLVSGLEPFARPFPPNGPLLFPSFEGLGLLPLVMRFWVVPSSPLQSTVPVSFRIRGAGGVMFASTAARAEPVYIGDPRWNFPAYLADVNVGAFPPGEYLLEVEPQGGNVRSFRLFGEPLGARWVEGRWPGNTLVAAAIDDDTLRVQRTSRSFPPEWTWDVEIPLAGGGVLPWSGTISGELRESWETNARWQGAAQLQIASRIAGQASEPNEVVSSLRGARLGEAGYRVEGDVHWEECAVVQHTAVPVEVSTAPCAGCPNEVFRSTFVSSPCVEFTGHASLAVGSDFRTTGTFTLALEPLALRSVEEALGFCRLRWWGAGSAGVQSRIAYDSSRSPGVFLPEDPCLAVSERWSSAVQCVGRMFAGPRVDFTPLLSCAVPLPVDGSGPYAPNPNPVLAADQSGKVLLLWVESSKTSSGSSMALAWRELTSEDGGAIGLLSPGSGAIDAPAVAPADAGSVVAVWVQSTLPPEAASTAEPGALNSSAEVASAVWKDGRWSAPVLLTHDDVADGRPVLVGMQDGAYAFWLRAPLVAGGNGAPGIAWARYTNDGGWQLGGPLASRSEGPIRDLAAGQTQDGTIVVAWLEEQPGGGSALFLVRRVGGEWRDRERVVLPESLRARVLRFVGGEAAPLLLIVGQEDGTRGPGGDLYAIEPGAGGWSTRRLTDGFRVDEFSPLGTSEGTIVFFRAVGGGGANEGNGQLWALILGSARLIGPLRLTADGAGHLSPQAVQEHGASELFVADVHQRGPEDLPQVTAHRWQMLPDVQLEDARWEWESPSSDTQAGVGDHAFLVVRVANRGLLEVRTPFSVRLRGGEEILDEQRVETGLLPGAATEVRLDPRGKREVGEYILVADEDNALLEAEKDDNVLRVPVRPPTPRLLGYTADELAGDVVLEWLPVPGAVQYRVYRTVGSAGGYELWAATGTNQFRDPEALVAGGGVSYRVAAVDAFGHESEPSAAVVVAGLAPPRPCTGDCNGDHAVTIDELLLGVNIALELEELTACTPFDATSDRAVTIDEILLAVSHALTGCP